ncbi:hypothetical protein QBC34DRAFT_423603 [Podospora aff. communis PSN243]|uniref:Uncharacterized protein n=1 Tax=Podospora aff. communis PSN243 TaxID=3040156 RepID=A0AAV9GTL1_9PEZI|nr:hypothetical protein QBC34DRAFT_423603 [Podospora aff. communis PSN243]
MVAAPCFRTSASDLQRARLRLVGFLVGRIHQPRLALKDVGATLALLGASPEDKAKRQAEPRFIEVRPRSVSDDDVGLLSTAINPPPMTDINCDLARENRRTAQWFSRLDKYRLQRSDNLTKRMPHRQVVARTLHTELTGGEPQSPQLMESTVSVRQPILTFVVQLKPPEDTLVFISQPTQQERLEQNWAKPITWSKPLFVNADYTSDPLHTLHLRYPYPNLK